MTRIPELGATLSVSKLDTALQKRISSKTGRQRSQRKTERSRRPDAEGVAKTSADIGGRINGSGDGLEGCIERDSPARHVPESSLSHFDEFGKRKSRSKPRSLDDTGGMPDDLRISFTAAKLSPRSRRNKEKRHREDIGKSEPNKESLLPESAPQDERLHTDSVDAVDAVDDIADDLGERSKVIESKNVIVKPGMTVRPRSESRLSQSRGDRTKKTRPSSGVEYNQSNRTASWSQNPREGHPPIADGEDEAAESKIRQIWRKELGLDVRPPRRQFGPKEYMTGMAIGYPGQKTFQPQQTVSTTVVPTANLSVNEIQKRRKVLPPIDSKVKGKGSKDDASPKPPAPNRIKDIDALAVDLCRGATIEVGNTDAETVYRTYREARKNAFYFDLPPNIGSARLKYHRPCHAPPNSDDDDGYDDGDVQEVWNDSSYCRIVRISSPDNDGETVITHTVDASKVLDFGGRVVRKTQIDVFLPSDAPENELHSGNEHDGDEVVDDGANGGHEGLRNQGDKNENACDTRVRVVRPQIGSEEHASKRKTGETEKHIQKKSNYDAYEEDDEDGEHDDSENFRSDESSEDDDEDDDN